MLIVIYINVRLCFVAQSRFKIFTMQRFQTFTDIYMHIYTYKYMRTIPLEHYTQRIHSRIHRGKFAGELALETGSNRARNKMQRAQQGL